MKTVAVELTKEELKYLSEAMMDAEVLIYRRERLERAVINNDPGEVPAWSSGCVERVYFKLLEASKE